jgi:anti-sigma factor RsiW
MNCRHCEEHLADFVAGRLAPAEAADLQAHLDRCPRCARAAHSERALRMRFVEAPPVAEPPDLWLRVSEALAAPAPPQRRFALPRFWLYGMGAAAAATALLYVNIRQSRLLVAPFPAPVAASSDDRRVLTMVNEIREIGVQESNQLLEVTRASHQFGFPMTVEGEP